MNPLATSLTIMVGMLLSFLVEYVPGFTNAYQALSPEGKRLVMLLLLIITAGSTMLLSCYSPYSMGIDCTEQSAWDLGFATVIALGLGGAANQATHSLTKRP